MIRKQRLNMNRWGFRLLFMSSLVAGLWLLGTGTSHALTAEEQCFTSKINAARSSNLSTRSDLVSIARRHSQRMADSNEIYHNKNLANEAPDDWQSLGENVGMGPSCASIHDAFMNSSSHRQNILDPDFNFVGVGVVIASDGTIFVTEVFMQASQPAPSQPAPTESSAPTKAPTTKTTARATAPPVAAPAPPPPPPPPPGSKVPAQTKSYMSRIESEPLPSAEEQVAYREYRQASEQDHESDAGQQIERAARNPSFLSSVFAFIGAVLSGSF